VADTANIKEQTSEPKAKTPSIPAPAKSQGDDGLSMGQKLFLVGAIVGICALFVRSRGGSESLKAKSMA
jgi:peptidyl-prolyl cis-trans isomerase B (cyclophilin B)